MCAGINLLSEQKELGIKNKRLFYIIIVLNSVVLFGVLLVWYVALWQTLNSANKKSINAKNKLYKLEQKTLKLGRKQNNISNDNFVKQLNMITNNQNMITSIFSNINNNIITNMQLTQLSINTNQGKLFGTTEEIIDITKILQDFMRSQYCIKPVVEKIVRQNYRYSFILSWKAKY